MKKGCWLIIILFFAFGCQNDGPKQVNTTTSGETQIIVDESLAPIVQDQWDVFTTTYPKANIKFMYKPETQLLNDFLNKKIMTAVMARKLRPDELKSFERKELKIRVTRFAIDAIALIANKSAVDTTITIQEIIDVMQGKAGKVTLVFDNANSSTVRYLKEIAGVKQLPVKNVYALKSNVEVINFVHNNKGVIGVIGVNWIKYPSKEIAPLVENIKVLGVKNLPGKPGGDRYYKPSQNNLALELYPLRRELYIINGQGPTSLGTGFASFIASERGQRIVLKSGLLPDSLPSREIIIR